jgi:hypothetical protein
MGVKRIGEILLEHGFAEPAGLKRALAEQRDTGKRLCSLLIARGQLDPDDAARALGEQLGVAAVLQRHLEHREQALAKLLSPALARAYVALPIGRMRSGDVIICVRDPRPAMRDALAKAVPAGETIVLAVAPAVQLEQLVARVYGIEESNEFDVDMTTGPIASIDIDLNTGPIRIVAGDPLSDLGAMTLVELDDAGVTRDPTQAGRAGSSWQAARETMPPFTMPQTTTAPPRRLEPPPKLGDTLTSLSSAITRDVATELAMKFVAGRWIAALLLTIKEGAALGHRGHGAQLSADAVQAVAFPLSAPSIVKAAHDERTLITAPPAGPRTIQDRLERMLSQPRFPAAAPVMVATRIACVLAVGDPISGDTDAALADLDSITAALGEAYARIVREAKRS